MMKPRIPKPTSGHLDRSFFFQGVQRLDENFLKNEHRNSLGTFGCPEVGLGIPIKNENRNSRGTFSCPEVGLGLLKK